MVIGAVMGKKDSRVVRPRVHAAAPTRVHRRDQRLHFVFQARLFSRPIEMLITKKQYKNHIQNQLAENMNVYWTHMNNFIQLTNRTKGPKTLKGLISNMEKYKKDAPLSNIDKATLNKYLKMAKKRDRFPI